MALTKPNGGLRPIAVGELLRRPAGKCLMNLVREDAGSYFWPAQVGVAVKKGCEKAVHTVRAWVERHAGSSQKVLVKLDFANAFNSVQRDAVLQQVVDHFPALSRWATWCYRQPTRLQFGDRVLSSSSGVQQGDPLGPLLFAAALQPLARELRSRPLDLAIHFLDDGVLAGDLAAVSAALTEVQLRAAEIGLVLNLSKCEVVVFGAVDETTLRAHFPNAFLQNPDGSGKVLRNFEFLGAAIGDAAYIQAHTAARTAKAGELLDMLADLEDPQVGLRLLRACGLFSDDHSMRCNPAMAQVAALTSFDDMVRRCFSGLTGIHATAAQWGQAARGFAQAGLGLRSCATHAPAAYLASLGSCLAGCAELDPAFTAAAAQASRAVVETLQALNSNLPANETVTLDTALSSTQHALSQRVDLAAWASSLLTLVRQHWLDCAPRQAWGRGPS